MSYRLVAIVLAVGCHFQNYTPCDPQTGDRRHGEDDRGSTGFSAADVVSAVEGRTWQLEFAPVGLVDDPTPFLTDLTVHVTPTGDGDEFTVDDDSLWSEFPGCRPGTHLRVPIELAIETSAGTFGRNRDDVEEPTLDALSLDPADIRVIGDIFPLRNPFVDAVGGTCWPGNDGIRHISIVSDGTLVEPVFSVSGSEPDGVQCASIPWEGHIPADESSASTAFSGTEPAGG